MLNNYQRERQMAVKIVRQAALLCRAVQAGLVTSALAKSDRSPVTVADFSSQALVCRALQQEFPTDPVIGEEDSATLRQPEQSRVLELVTQALRQQGIAGQPAEVCGWIDRGGTQNYAERFWTLDPIDGTKGFLRGEQYAVALALVVHGQIEVAALGCPNLSCAADDSKSPAGGAVGAIFFAIRGQGAYQELLDDSAGSVVPIRVSPQNRPELARFCESVESGHSSHQGAADVARILNLREPPLRMDSQVKYAVVGRGEADIYLRLPTSAAYQENIWDHAAGALIVAEAGGKVTDLAGKPLEFQHGRTLAANRGVVVSNHVLHETVLTALATAGIT